MSHSASAQPTTVASVRQVRLRYGDVIALDGIDLDIPAGRMVGLIGPDGVGKSSLLSLLAGVRIIQEGTVEVLGGDMASKAHRKQVCPRIAYMPQGLGKNLYPTLSVEENLQFFARLFGHDAPERRQRIDGLLHAFLDVAAHILVRIQLRFLRQVADFDAGQMLHFAVVFLVHPGHDLEHGGLPRTVQAQEANLGTGKERQRDVFDDLPLGRHNFAHAEHGHDVLGHISSFSQDAVNKNGVGRRGAGPGKTGGAACSRREFCGK